jgi:hypothetical protein
MLKRMQSTVTPTSRSAARAAGRAAVVGARGGRELGVLATIAALSMHLVAALLELLNKLEEALAVGGSRRKAAQSGGIFRANPDAPLAALHLAELLKPSQGLIRGCRSSSRAPPSSGITQSLCGR